MTREKVPSEVPDILKDHVEELRIIFPEVFSEDRIDFGKLRTELGESVESSPEKFTFSWAGRRKRAR